jgi:surface protein
MTKRVSVTDYNIRRKIKKYFTNRGDMTAIGDWDVSRVTNMKDLFHININKRVNNIDLTNFNEDISNWDVSKVTNMEQMFFGLSNFNQPLNNWNVSNVDCMAGMFGNTTKFNQPLNNWDVSNVLVMSGMFGNAKNFNQSLNNWDVSNVKNMSCMFYNAKRFNQPLNNWDVSSVEYISSMFEKARVFNQPLNNWNLLSVTDMNSTFEGATQFNQPLDNWNVREVDNMAFMFKDAVNFNQSLVNWQLDSHECIYAEDMFTNAIHMTNDKIPRRMRSEMYLRGIRGDDNYIPYEESMQKQLVVVPEEEQESPYEDCNICMFPLDNIHGPDTLRFSSNNCKDVIQICHNNHMTHRGCILASCNNELQKRSHLCPFCMTPLLHSCNQFKTIPKVEQVNLHLKQVLITSGK